MNRERSATRRIAALMSIGVGEPPEGVIRCETFIENVKTLCRFLGKTK